MKEYLMIAEVLKPQGINGEVKLKPYTSDVNSFASWDTLYTEEKGTYLPLSSEVTRIQPDFVYTVLGGATSMNEADRYRGLKLYIDRSHVTMPDDGQVLIADLMGCKAVDESGKELGTLTDVLQYGTVDTYVFKTAHGTMMAPALLAVFPEVDVVNGIIHVVSERLQEVAVFED